MRATLRAAGFIAAGACGLLFALAGVASADIVSPKSAEQPVSSQLEGSPPKPIASSAPATATGAEGSPGADADAAGAASPAPAVEGQVPASPVPTLAPLPPRTTPAPEQMITRVPSAASRTSDARAEQAPAPLRQAAVSVQKGLHDVGVFLGQAAGACPVGVASGTGGLVLVLAVLSMATALTRHRVLGARLIADEDAPEFLYAREVIAPG